ncbi:DUF2721 domain-containing protein [Geomobilimonas luticola]|uniref:DUF2721 domain-containing protein n=1 Tax=Geomobilimonas luticola TaxID=1114878 RepID=A0ABS5SDU6_9BACT|nr:DUF2721 domain-containing protein [Geomobilimonas luticola]MBT0653545.1 DUF2721 domain-containing protein [Geomobilimonas luticola]
MAMVERELLDALSSARILTSMITPAVLISACGTLIFSTSARLGRIFDRVNALKGELEEVLTDRLSYPGERIAFLRDQFQLQRIRAGLIQKAMAALYTATALFVAASLAIAFNVAYGTADTAWIPTAIALLGGVFLFVASAILLYESRFNLRFVSRHLDFIQFLQDQHEQKGDGH